MWLRHLTIVFFQPRLHFREQRVLQRLRRRQGRRGIGILGFEIRADARVEQIWLAHDLLPIGSAQPAIVVGERNTVIRQRNRGAIRVWSGQGRNGQGH